MLDKGWVIFIEINLDFQRAFFAAKELGLKVLLITERELKLHSYLDESVTLQGINFESVKEFLGRFEHADNIMSFWSLKDHLIPLSCKLNQEFALNKMAYNLNLVNLTKNKILMRNALVGTSYNPDFKVIPADGPSQHPSPEKKIVLKPSLGYASIGVEKVNTDKDYPAVLERCRSTLKRISLSIPSYDSNQEILAEEYLEEPEFSVEVFANKSGLKVMGIAGKGVMKPPFFEEVSYYMPPNISTELKEKLSNAAIDIMNILGMNSGMAHIEFRLKDNEPIVLDIGMRLGGSGLTHSLVFASTGVDLVKAVLAELCGFESDTYLHTSSQDIGVLYLLQVKSGGVLKSIPSFESLETRFSSEFIEGSFFYKPGQILNPYPAYSGLPGYVIYKLKGQSDESYQRLNGILDDTSEVLALEYQ